MGEPEIELIDYLNVIWKRKGLIVGGTVLAAAAALVVSVSMPKTYEVHRTLKIGHLPGEFQKGTFIEGRPIEKREAVIGHLKDQKLLRRVIEELQLDLTPKEIADGLSIDRRTNPHVRYTVQAHDPQLATRIADWVAGHIIGAHRQILDRWVRIARDYEIGLSARVRSLEAENRRMKEVMGGIIRTPDVNAATLALLQANIGERERSLGDLRRELKQARLSRLGYENTSVIAADAPPEYPVKPKVKLNVALAGTLGVMLFTFLAFFLEYIENARGRKT